MGGSQSNLLAAADAGNTRTVKELLALGVDVSATSQDEGWTVLHVGSFHGHLGVVQAVIASAHALQLLEVRDKKGRTALHLAASEDRAQVVSSLLEAGAAGAAKDGNGLLPIHKAAFTGAAAALAVLARQRRHINEVLPDGAAPLHLAARKVQNLSYASVQAGSMESITTLLAAGADVELQTRQGATPLHEAAATGDLLAVKALLRAQNKRPLRTKDARGLTPAEVAAKEGYDEVSAAIRSAEGGPLGFLGRMMGLGNQRQTAASAQPEATGVQQTSAAAAYQADSDGWGEDGGLRDWDGALVQQAAASTPVPGVIDMGAARCILPVTKQPERPTEGHRQAHTPEQPSLSSGDDGGWGEAARDWDEAPVSQTAAEGAVPLAARPPLPMSEATTPAGATEVTLRAASPSAPPVPAAVLSSLPLVIASTQLGAVAKGVAAPSWAGTEEGDLGWGDAVASDDGWGSPRRTAQSSGPSRQPEAPTDRSIASSSAPTAAGAGGKNGYEASAPELPLLSPQATAVGGIGAVAGAQPLAQASNTMAERETQLSEQQRQIEELTRQLQHSQMMAASRSNQSTQGQVPGKGTNPYCQMFTGAELAEATGGFGRPNQIGAGGYGEVYQGVLRSHTRVAVKRLNKDSMQGAEELWREVNVLSRIRHPHIVLLLGACPEEGCLVYELMQGGSLEEALEAGAYSKAPLQWHDRVRIAYEIAVALLVLHEAQPDSIFHRDFKPANVLLDAHLTAKLADVGLARIAPDMRAAGLTHVQDTTPVGTLDYIDPEYLHTGRFSPASDTYSLGITLLQILSGRPPRGPDGRTLHDLVASLYRASMVHEAIDPKATRRSRWPVEEAAQLAHLGLRCCAYSRTDRPPLSEVVRILQSLATSSACVAASQQNPEASSKSALDDPPPMFICPITQEVMEDPVVASDGYTYERSAIAQWLAASHSTSPMSNAPLPHKELTPNYTLRSAISDWNQAHDAKANAAKAMVTD